VIRAAALLAAACGAAQAETWLYRVALDPDEPLLARVVVELPAARRVQDFSVQARGLAAGVSTQVGEIRCDGAPLAPDSASAWQVQAGRCLNLTWTVALSAPPEGGVDLRAKESFHDSTAGYWLFSEATSLLRPVDDARHGGEIDFVGRGPAHGAAPVGATARRLLPAADDSFGFYVIGRLPGATVREGGFETLHLDADGGDRRVLVAEHGRALRYLGRAAGARQLAPLRSTVVWIGGATDDGTPVGVAGYRTLLLSTATRDGRMQQEETALAWLLREQLLQAMPDRLPTWARESLAQYYAIRALRRSELPPSAVAMVERRLLDAPAPHSRLREAQRRLEAGDEPARAELRAAGATFWERVDRAIVRKSGFRTLDSVLPQLLAAQWPGGRLPPAVRERLQRYAGESAIEELLAQYVGD
jgi:hypothetical protein